MAAELKRMSKASSEGLKEVQGTCTELRGYIQQLQGSVRQLQGAVDQLMNRSSPSIGHSCSGAHHISAAQSPPLPSDLQGSSPTMPKSGGPRSASHAEFSTWKVVDQCQPGPLAGPVTVSVVAEGGFGSFPLSRKPHSCETVHRVMSMGDDRLDRPHDCSQLSSQRGTWCSSSSSSLGLEEGLIAVNYAARAKGVTRFMRLNDAKRACPDLILVHVQTIGENGCTDTNVEGSASSRGGTKACLQRYRLASGDIMRVLRKHLSPSAVMEKAGIDECFFDVTAMVEEELSAVMKLQAHSSHPRPPAGLHDPQHSGNSDAFASEDPDLDSGSSSSHHDDTDAPTNTLPAHDRNGTAASDGTVVAAGGGETGGGGAAPLAVGERCKTLFELSQRAAAGSVVLGGPLDVRFYAQVEQKRLGIVRDVPVAVQQWEGLIAVNYAARAKGVTRFMRLNDAKRACPDLILVHVQTIGEDGCTDTNVEGSASSRGGTKACLQRYRLASGDIMRVLRKHLSPSAVMEKAGIDECFFDVTAMVEEELSAIMKSQANSSNPRPPAGLHDQQHSGKSDASASEHPDLDSSSSSSHPDDTDANTNTLPAHDRGTTSHGGCVQQHTALFPSTTATLNAAAVTAAVQVREAVAAASPDAAPSTGHAGEPTLTAAQLLSQAAAVQASMPPPAFAGTQAASDGTVVAAGGGETGGGGAAPLAVGERCKTLFELSQRAAAGSVVLGGPLDVRVGLVFWVRV
ncbi:MAG: hypothetical protein WDW38_003477 [Sanguina aurantia]